VTSQIFPLGLVLSRTSKAVGRAFEDALAGAGGSTPAWLILLALRQAGTMPQSDLAAAVGVQGPTLTHHLNAMEAQGLVTRARVEGNRRAHNVAMTLAGQAAFDQLRAAAAAHDARLRQGFTADELATLRDLLGRLGANVGLYDRPQNAEEIGA
jgi:MarR family transcriptional regulator for hemolysin